MNDIDLIRRNLVHLWDVINTTGTPNSELPADHQAQLDQARARAMSLVREHGFDVDDRPDLVLAFLCGGLSAIDSLAGDLEGARQMLRPEVLTEWAAPILMNLNLRAWGMEASRLADVPVE